MATVTVRPLNIIDLIVEDVPTAAAAFYETYTQDVVDAMTEEEYRAYDQEWANIILTVAQENLADMGYLPEQTTEIKVSKQDGYWMLTDESMQQLDLLLIQYS